jgi:hypothetical protein
MKDQFDFSECEYINSNMKFYTYEDFYEHCIAIKRLYDGLSRNGKRFYMWYVYANIHITIGQKNKIWDYINEYSTREQLLEGEK